MIRVRSARVTSLNRLRKLSGWIMSGSFSPRNCYQMAESGHKTSFSRCRDLLNNYMQNPHLANRVSTKSAIQLPPLPIVLVFLPHPIAAQYSDSVLSILINTRKNTRRNFMTGTRHMESKCTYTCGGIAEGKFYYEMTYRSTGNVHTQNCEMD